jgi:hypothetical protein
MITIFVVEEEYDLYKNVLPDYEIVVGKLGIVPQRNFIENYFEGKLIFLDDDITHIDVPNLLEFFHHAFEECEKRKAYLWSVYPVYNPFFRKTKQEVTEYLSFCIGAFYGVITRKDPDLQLHYSMEGNKEDVERSIRYFKKDGKVLRFNKVGFKTKYYGSVGGLGTLKQRLPTIISIVDNLVNAYPEYGYRKIRKSGIHEFVLRRLTEHVHDASVHPS